MICHEYNSCVDLVETNRTTTVSWLCVPGFSTATGIKGRAIAAASPASTAGAVASTAVTAATAAALEAPEVATRACSRRFIVVVLAVAAAGAPATIT